MIRSPAGFDGGDRIKRYLDYYQPSYGVMMLSAGQAAAFSPASLFAAGEQGVWYDPSDFSTMFQDSAGTTPVTAVEQPVGRILDKSGRSNHATQSTTASRPVLSARVNLLTYSEQFDNAAWNKDNVTVTANAVAAPYGTTTADQIVEAATTSFHRVYANGISVIGGVDYTLSVYAKAGGRDFLALFFTTGGVAGAYFNLANGTIGTVNAGFVASITSAENGWYICSISTTPSTSATFYPLIGPAQANGTANYAGNGTSGIYLWGADLRPTNQTTLLPAYQRIAAATDYDTTGFPYYLRFDGADDSMATGTITPGIDKAQVFAGVRKLSDAALGVIAEMSTTLSANNGTFNLGNSAAPTYFFRSRGTSASNTSSTSAFASPITNVISGIADIASDVSTIRINGSVNATDATDQGTGNFLAYPLYIGSRGGSSLRFNGNIYSLIVRFGSNLDATTISNTETYVNGKTLAY